MQIPSLGQEDPPGAETAQRVKYVPEMQKTGVGSLGWENSLEKGMATHSNSVIWRISRREEPGGLYSPWGCKERDMTERLTAHTHMLNMSM